MDCIFCKIISGDIPSTKVYEDEFMFAFKDINPQAPVHVLVIPKKHITGLDDVNENNVAYVTEIFKKIPEIAKMCGLKNGYRLVSNCGPDACQTVPHLHFHILGGRQMGEQMA